MIEGYDKKQKCIIMDIDGTLANVKHRLHYVVRPDGSKKDWESFFRAAVDDSVNEEIKILNSRQSQEISALGQRCYK